MPTCPAFSSDGVPGPDCGAESAPSVALYTHFGTNMQCIWTKKEELLWTTDRGRGRAKINYLISYGHYDGITVF